MRWKEKWLSCNSINVCIIFLTAICGRNSIIKETLFSFPKKQWIKRLPHVRDDFLKEVMNETNSQWPPSSEPLFPPHQQQLQLDATIDLLRHLNLFGRSLNLQSASLSIYRIPFIQALYFRTPFLFSFSLYIFPSLRGCQRLTTKPGWVRKATWLEGREVKAKGCIGTADDVCMWCMCMCMSMCVCVREG